MKQLTPLEFLDRVESGMVDWKGTIGRRVYGVDYSYDAALWASGKYFQVVWADIP